MTFLTELSSYKYFDGLQKTYSHFSHQNDWEMKFSVYLPPVALKGEQCPILYWLTGRTLGEFGFINKSGMQRYASKYGMIVVVPEPTPRGIEAKQENGSLEYGAQIGGFIDSITPRWSKHYRMYSYLIQELIPIIDSHFNVNVKQRVITGHSYGASTAVPIALRNPDKFISVSAMSGYYDLLQNNTTLSKIFNLYLGDDESKWEDYQTLSVIKRYNGPSRTILLDQGGHDPVFINPSTELFATCRNTNISVIYRQHSGYHHAYQFIQTFLEDHFDFHCNILKGNKQKLADPSQ